MHLTKLALGSLAILLLCLMVTSTSAAAKQVNDCSASTFTDLTTKDSPLIEHCRIIASNIAHGGTWRVSTGLKMWHQLVQYRSCAFRVYSVDYSGYIKVGNQDIIDIIDDAIGRFGRDGYVGASGNMSCQSKATHPWVEGVRWEIRYND